MKSRQSNFNLRSPGSYLPRSYPIATVPEIVRINCSHYLKNLSRSLEQNTIFLKNNSVNCSVSTTLKNQTCHENKQES